ncbi:MAG: prepilin-type N-terminal cleavage/methylation domain-containing protein [Acidobacteria bacterium]|nr:prepilin-type N-terminal cleavage/methylation domain-containing protein [Acidobacteriota bacterium]
MRQEHIHPGERGFSLVEVVISAGLLATVAAGASYLVTRAVEEGEGTRIRTVASVAALQKMEQIRALAWHDEVDSETDLAGEDAATGGPGLLPSPAGTLDASVPPYVDYLSREGLWMDSSEAAEAMFARRWAVQAHDGVAETLVLRVVVTRARGPMSRTSTHAGLQDVQLVSLKARRQP